MKNSFNSGENYISQSRATLHNINYLAKCESNSPAPVIYKYKNEEGVTTINGASQ